MDRVWGTLAVGSALTGMPIRLEEIYMISRYVLIIAIAAGVSFAAVPSYAEDVGIGVGPVGVTVHDNDRDRDRDHDKKVIIKKDRDDVREKTVIKKEHDRD